MTAYKISKPNIVFEKMRLYDIKDTEKDDESINSDELSEDGLGSDNWL